MEIYDLKKSYNMIRYNTIQYDTFYSYQYVKQNTIIATYLEIYILKKKFWLVTSTRLVSAPHMWTWTLAAAAFGTISSEPEITAALTDPPIFRISSEMKLEQLITTIYRLHVYYRPSKYMHLICCYLQLIVTVTSEKPKANQHLLQMGFKIKKKTWPYSWPGFEVLINQLKILRCWECWE